MEFDDESPYIGASADAGSIPAISTGNAQPRWESLQAAGLMTIGCRLWAFPLRNVGHWQAACFGSKNKGVRFPPFRRRTKGVDMESDADGMVGNDGTAGYNNAYSSAKGHDFKNGPAPQSCGTCSQPPSRH